MSKPNLADTRRTVNTNVTPPHNIEAEQALLGDLLINGRSFEAVSEFDARQFFDPVHEAIFEAIAEHMRDGRAVSPITISARLSDLENIGELTIQQYIARLVTEAAGPSNVPDLARLIAELAKRRQILLLAEEMLGGCGDLSRALPSQISDYETRLYNLTGDDATSREFTSKRMMDWALKDVTDAIYRGDGMSGLTTGLRDLDGLIGGLGNSNLIVLAGRPAMGKAQPLEAKILRRDGTFSSMGSLAIGDELASIDGVSSSVVGVFPRGDLEVFRVTMSDGRSCEACDDHLWRVKYRDWDDARVVTTKKLRSMLEAKRYQGRIIIERASGRWGRELELGIDPYALGVLIGDGNIIKSPRFCTPSAHVISRMTDIAQDAGLERTSHDDGIHHVMSGGRNGGKANAISDALAKLELRGARSWEKFIPEKCFSMSRDQRLQLMRGLMDTDGWVEQYGTAYYGTTSERLADGVVQLARSLGYVTSKRSRVPKFKSRGEIKEGRLFWKVGIYGPGRDELVTRPERVARLQNRAPHTLVLTVKSIEAVGRKPCQCIAVSHSSKMYITDDYVVTHNSALATNIAYNVAKTGTPVGIFSQEMSAVQLAMRVLGEHAGIASHRLRTGKVDPDKVRNLRDVTATLGSLPITVDETGGLSLAALTAKARRWKRQKQIGLLVIDYIQLMRGSSRSGNRVEDVTEITTGLKALAKELAVPIIALSQLSRALENRENKRPQLSDLRESGSIEQDADEVLFVFREEYYVARDEPSLSDPVKYQEWRAKLEAVTGLAEVIAGKSRHGPTGIVKLQFEAHLTRFSDLARVEPNR